MFSYLRGIVAACCVGAVAFIAPGAAEGATRYLAPDGSAANSGATFQTPWSLAGDLLRQRRRHGRDGGRQQSQSRSCRRCPGRGSQPSALESRRTTPGPGCDSHRGHPGARVGHQERECDRKAPGGERRTATGRAPARAWARCPVRPRRPRRIPARSGSAAAGHRAPPLPRARAQRPDPARAPRPAPVQPPRPTRARRQGAHPRALARRRAGRLARARGHRVRRRARAPRRSGPVGELPRPARPAARSRAGAVPGLSLPRKRYPGIRARHGPERARSEAPGPVAGTSLPAFESPRVHSL